MPRGKKTQTGQLVELVGENSKPMASSLEIAKNFRRLHKDVLRAIEIAIKEVSPDFNRRNFAPVEYKDAKGETRPSYLLTRDGFSYICMGFTGRSAAQWKEKYIDAFNKMEESIIQGQGKKPPLKLPKMGAEELREAKLTVIKGLLGFWVFMDGISKDIATRTMCAALNLVSLDDFQDEHFVPAWEFIYRAFFMPSESGKPSSEDSEFERQAGVVGVGLLEAVAQLRNCRVRGLPRCIFEASFLTREQFLQVDASKQIWLLWGVFQFWCGYSLSSLREETIKFE